MRAGRLILVAGAVLVLLLSNLACCCGVPRAIQEGVQVRWPWTIVRGSGNLAEEERSLSGFTGVALRSAGDLFVEQGETESIRIEAEDNLLPYLETRLEGTLLVLDTKKGTHLRTTRPILFRVTVVDLDRLEVSGSGDVEGDGLEVGDISLSVSGSGDMELSGLDADTVRARISGSGEIDVSGSARSQDVTVSGSGNYRARTFETVAADVRISGSGSALVNVSERLDATISGSGSVRYVGSPSVESSVSGSGSIRPAGD